MKFGFGRYSNLNRTIAQTQKLGYFSTQTGFQSGKPQDCWSDFEHFFTQKDARWSYEQCTINNSIF